MRRKTLVYDGAEFVISPLTLEQVDRYTTPIEKLETMTIEEKRNALRERAYDLICDSLNNAFIGDPTAAAGGALWTRGRVYGEIDLVTFGKLQEEILAFSGLELKKKGGAEAAVEEPSPESVAVS